MWKRIREREAGEGHPKTFRTFVEANRISDIHLSNSKEIISPHKGSINSLQVDLTEARYLLSSASDGSTAVFDIQRPTDSDKIGIEKHECLFSVNKQHEDCHRYSVASAVWYPIDTGVFVTGSFDHLIKVWDTNTTQMVSSFRMPGKVYRVAMSPLASSHTLIAAGTEDVQVRLCDISSGAFSHTLSGHRDGVMAVEWSNSSEYVVITGGCDGAIRFWDIRRVGCFRVLDQNKCQYGRRTPLLTRGSGSSSNKALPSTRMSSSTPISAAKQPKQRLHPGLRSVNDRATAHYGAVTGLRATHNGLYLLSSGSDSRIRLWDAESCQNTLVNFDTVRLRTSQGIQMASTRDDSIVFVPCMAVVKAFDVWSGETLNTYRGHYESVNCCWFDSHEQVLYSGGNDRQILTWTSSVWSADETLEDGDCWSD